MWRRSFGTSPLEKAGHAQCSFCSMIRSSDSRKSARFTAFSLAELWVVCSLGGGGRTIRAGDAAVQGETGDAPLAVVDKARWPLLTQQCAIGAVVACHIARRCVGALYGACRAREAARVAVGRLRTNERADGPGCADVVAAHARTAVAHASRRARHARRHAARDAAALGNADRRVTHAAVGYAASVHIRCVNGSGGVLGARVWLAVPAVVGELLCRVTRCDTGLAHLCV